MKLNYNIDFELIAFIFTILLFIETGIAYPKNSRKNHLFRFMTGVVVITEAFDLVSAFTLTYGASCPILINLFVNSGYFMSGVVLCFLLQYYIEHTIIPEEGKSVLLGVNKIIMVIIEITLVLNVFFGYYFHFTPQGNYVHGPLYLVLHVVSCWFVLCGSAALFINRKLIKPAQLISSFLFVALYFSAVILQTFVYSDVLIIMPAASAMLIITIFTLETPDYGELQKTLRELTNTQKELEAANKKYLALAYTDLMTGLKNRSAYHARMDAWKTGSEDTIILIADINQMKVLNDQYGHQIGDEAITKAANIMKKNFTENCNCYRIGGDEFVVIADGMKEEEFKEKYEQMMLDVQETDRNCAYPFSFAAGYKRLGSLTPTDAAKLADDNMYQSKAIQKQIQCETKMEKSVLLTAGQLRGTKA